jgi:hypothetical protein
MGIPALRQFIDATMHLAPIAMLSEFAASIIPKFYFVIFSSVHRLLPAD